jgi:hypothetical protein
LERARSKRIYKEEPSNLHLSYEQDFGGKKEGSQKDGSVGDVFCASIDRRRIQQAFVNFYEDEVYTKYRKTHPHWAKAYLEITVRLIGAKRSI